MMANFSKASALALAVSLLSACDYIERRQDLVNERTDGAYQSAMSDYRAGRIEQAVKGFKTVIRKSPANAAARFQYACLMQDVKKNYLEAFCNYREYLLQHPESEKAKLARDRLAQCERELAKELADKYDLADRAAVRTEMERLRAEIKAAETRAASAERQLSEEQGKYRALSGEHERLLAVVKGTEENVKADRPVIAEVKDLLNEEEEETTDRKQTVAEVAAVKAEEKDETAAGTSLLPEQTNADVARRDEAKAKAREKEMAEAAAAAAERAKRPPTYVVQEGDTLYKISLRFYGRIGAWRHIRDANRAIISNDGRVRAGQTIKLP